VGIGTTTPGQPLDVLGDVMVGGDSTAHDGGGEVVVFRGESGDWRVGVQNELTEEESDFFIGLNSSEDGTFHIERGGNVGIGTTEPAAKLDVRNLPLMGRANAVYGKGGSVLDPTEGYLGNLEQGVYGEHLESGNYGYLGGEDYGVYGYGDSAGVCGWSSDITYGLLGCLHYGIFGKHRMTGTYGYLGGVRDGVVGYGDPDCGYGVRGVGEVGVWGEADDGKSHGSIGGPTYGVYGRKDNHGNVGYLGSEEYGAYGGSDSSGNYGYLGSMSHGVYGKDGDSGNYGYIGNANYGMYARNDSSGNYGYIGSLAYGLRGFSSSGRGVYASSTTGYAGYFSGDVHITGELSKGTGTFIIDHPLDPENKLLRHNYVESPENLVIYRGKARLDGNGETVVMMPDYFPALTREGEASIHLTPVGRPFLTGAEWNSGYRSLTVYGQAGREVFWEVLADRDDPVVRQLARPVEEDKGPDNKLCDRGELLYPKAYGYPESMGRDYEDQLEKERLDQEEVERQERLQRQEKSERQRKEERELSRRVVETDGERKREDGMKLSD